MRMDGGGDAPEALYIRAGDRLEAAIEGLSEARRRPGGRRRPGVWRAALRELREAFEDADRMGKRGVSA